MNFRIIYSDTATEFIEDEHPRDEDGKFTDKGTAPSADKQKPTNAPAQPTATPNQSAPKSYKMSDLMDGLHETQKLRNCLTGSPDSPTTSPCSSPELGQLRAADQQWMQSLDTQERSVVNQWSKKAYKGIRAASQILHQGQIVWPAGMSAETFKAKCDDVQLEPEAWAQISRSLKPGGSTKLPDSAAGMVAQMNDDFAQALAAAPAYQGVVVRGASLSAENWQQMINSQQVTFDAPASASLDFSIAHGFAKDYPDGPGRHRVLMRITSKSGRYIGQASDLSMEHEVVVPAGTKFRLKGTGTWGKMQVVELEEIA